VSRLRSSVLIAALTARASIHAAALHAQTRADTLAVLHAVERALHVPLAKPGAEGHFLLIGVAPPLAELGSLVSETFGRLCVEGSHLTPELGIASIELTRFVVAGDTALVQIRTTDGGGTSGTLDLWRLRREPGGRWEGAVASGSAWEGDVVQGRAPALSFCRGREPG
jgi:hypothetical protein